MLHGHVNLLLLELLVLVPALNMAVPHGTLS
jgi:hypothetical protein